jgi:ketosteroid isomerase-like protein
VPNIVAMTMTHAAALGGLTADEAKALAIRSMQVMVDGTPAEFDELVHPDAVNREGKDEPPAARGRGPAASYATALWLRAMFADLAFEVHEVAQEGDLVVVHNTMSGRQTGVALFYGPDGGAIQAMPATGKRFATTQTHWLRLRDGKVVEHWHQYDAMGQRQQLSGEGGNR